MQSDPFSEEIRNFQATIAIAKQTGEKEIETSQEIIDFFNPTGLGGAKHFIFQGVIVYPIGESEQIKAAMNESIAKKLHGAKEGVLVGL